MEPQRWMVTRAALTTLLLSCWGCATATPQAAAGLFDKPPQAISKQVLAGPRGGLSKRLGDLLSGLRGELDGIDAKHGPQLAKLNEELQALRQSEAPTAKAKLTELQKEADAVRAQHRDEQVNARYARGPALLKEMILSTQTTTQIIDALTLDGSLPVQKDHWDDQQLRNEYDAARDWGLVTGAGLLLVGGVVLAIGGAEPRPATGTGNEGVTSVTIGGIIVAAGAATMGVCALLGHLAGEESGDELKERAKAVAVTTRAHDDLSVRIERLRAFKSSLQSFLQKLEKLQQSYDAAGPDVDKRIAVLAKLGRQMDRFMGYVERMTELLDWYASLLAKYQAGAVAGPLAGDLGQLEAVIESAKRLFRDGVSGFQARGDEIAELFGHE